MIELGIEDGALQVVVELLRAARGDGLADAAHMSLAVAVVPERRLRKRRRRPRRLASAL